MRSSRVEQRWSKLVGVPIAPASFSWTPRTVALYHLGLGISPDLERNLAYLLDAEMQVLPTFATLACFPALIHLDEVPGLGEIDLARVLHSRHSVALSGPIPSSGGVRTDGEIAEVAVRGTNLHLTVEQRSRTPDGALSWTNRYTMVCRGSADANGASARERQSPRQVSSRDAARGARRLAPAIAVDTPIAANLAHVYRQSGDDNPLHVDPAYARRGGFDQPILHGLCTLGVATHAVIDALVPGTASSVRRVAVEFADVVLPGTTLSTVMRQTPASIEFEAWVGDRRVLDSGVIKADSALPASRTGRDRR